jgi:transcription-repair coupling factor (superfamily II helicase)
MENRSALSIVQQSPEISATLNLLRSGEKTLQWEGLVGSSLAFYAAATAEIKGGKHLFILEDKEAAAYFLNDLQGISGSNERALFFPASMKNPYQLEDTDNANVVYRAEVLERMNSDKKVLIVTYPEALFEKVPTQRKLVNHTMKIEVGKEYTVDFLNELLLEYGFDRVDFVYHPGQFAIRGGILDVFSFSADHPFRI